MEKKTFKTRKEKKFSLSLTCAVFPKTEFEEKYRKYYHYLSSTYTPRKTDNAFNCRLFYQKYGYYFTKFFCNDYTIEEYDELPDFICIESIVK